MKNGIIHIRNWIRTNGQMSDDGSNITFSCKELESVIAEALKPTTKQIDIKIDRTTLPADGQEVSWQTQKDIDAREWKTGKFSYDPEQDEAMFIYHAKENQFWDLAWEVHHWKPSESKIFKELDRMITESEENARGLKKQTVSKNITDYDRKKLRSLYVYLDKYDNEMVRKNIQRQIDEIKAKYK